MKRIVLVILLVAGLMALAAPAGANDQECATLTIVWTGKQPQITEAHYAAEGVRVAMVGDYLWTQYETTSDPSDGGAVLSTFIGPEVTAIEACPDGMVTLTVSAPPEGIVVIDVITYWEDQGFDLYPNLYPNLYPI